MTLTLRAAESPLGVKPLLSMESERPQCLSSVRGLLEAVLLIDCWGQRHRQSTITTYQTLRASFCSLMEQEAVSQKL